MEKVSKFNEKPKSDVAWKSMWFGLGTVAWLLLLFVLQNLRLPTPSFIFLPVEIGLAFAAIYVAVKSYKSGERSWVVWVGFLPAILLGGFWVYFVLGNIFIPY